MVVMILVDATLVDGLVLVDSNLPFHSTPRRWYATTHRSNSTPSCSSPRVVSVLLVKDYIEVRDF